MQLRVFPICSKMYLQEFEQKLQKHTKDKEKMASEDFFQIQHTLFILYKWHLTFLVNKVLLTRMACTDILSQNT